LPKKANSSEITEIRHKTVDVNGIKMHVAEKGDENAPIILFIHGFPELWYAWRHQMIALSHLGYRAIAPDMRATATQMRQPTRLARGSRPRPDPIEACGTVPAEPAVVEGGAPATVDCYDPAAVGRP
ncbi:AB hydrolase superfamily protein YfhM, partial [Bienertia sinuspersici]